MITVNVVNGRCNYLDLPHNKNSSSFDIHIPPQDKLSIDADNIDKIYQEKFGIANIDFLSNVVLNLHFSGLRYSSNEVHINSQYRGTTLDKFEQGIYSYAGIVSLSYYVEGKTKDEYGRLISLIEFQNEIHGKLSNITKTIEKQLDSIKNQNTRSDEKGEKLKDKLIDDFMKEINKKDAGEFNNNNSELGSLSQRLKVSLLNNKVFIGQANDLNRFCTQNYE